MGMIILQPNDDEDDDDVNDDNNIQKKLNHALTRLAKICISPYLSFDHVDIKVGPKM